MSDFKSVMLAGEFDVAVQPPVTAGAYSAGDIVGGLMTFPCAVNNNDVCVLDAVQITSKAAVISSWTLVLFDSIPTATTLTDNSPYSLNAADAFKVRAALPLNAMGVVFTDHGTPNTWNLGNLELPVTVNQGTKNLYALLIDGTGITLSTTNDIQVVLSGRGG